MVLGDLLEVGFREAAECPDAWQHKGKVICRPSERALISILWVEDSSELEILVGDVHQPLLHVRSAMLTLTHLQALLRDYWPAT